MDYDKQTPLTQEELDMLNAISPCFKVGNLKDYPKNNINLGVDWNIPITIARNEDNFYLNDDSNNENIEDNWVVYPKIDVAEETLDFEAKQFKDFFDALAYAMQEYQAWILMKQKEMFDIYKGMLAYRRK